MSNPYPLRDARSTAAQSDHQARISLNERVSLDLDEAIKTRKSRRAAGIETVANIDVVIDALEAAERHLNLPQTWPSSDSSWLSDAQATVRLMGYVDGLRELAKRFNRRGSTLRAHTAQDKADLIVSRYLINASTQ